MFCVFSLAIVFCFAFLFLVLLLTGFVVLVLRLCFDFCVCVLAFTFVFWLLRLCFAFVFRLLRFAPLGHRTHLFILHLRLVYWSTLKIANDLPIFASYYAFVIVSLTWYLRIFCDHIHLWEHVRGLENLLWPSASYCCICRAFIQQVKHHQKLYAKYDDAG